MQLALPGADPAAFLRGDDDPLVAEFLARHDAAPAVFEAFARFARQALAAGRTRIGAKMIAERIRWESFVAGAGDYKINYRTDGVNPVSATDASATVAQDWTAP